MKSVLVVKTAFVSQLWRSFFCHNRLEETPLTLLLASSDSSTYCKTLTHSRELKSLVALAAVC